MYIDRVEISNLRVFNKTSVDLLYPGRPGTEKLMLPNANLFLGPNGSGKSTLLKALVLAAAGPVLAISGSGFRPYYLVRRNHTAASVKGHLILDAGDGNGSTRSRHQTEIRVLKRGDLDDLQTILPASLGKKIWTQMLMDTSPAFFIVGYGSGRAEAPLEALSALTRQRSGRFQRVASVFEPTPGLMPLQGWLPALKKAQFLEVVDILNHLTGPEVRLIGEGGSGGDLFQWGKFPVPFRALSDGYRHILSLASDLLYHLSSVCPPEQKLQDLRGAVLIDEVDLLLHPEWQSRVAPSLCRAFPKLQFVLTSHSELVAGSLQQENIFVMKSQSGNRSVIDPAPNRPSYGLDAVQLLHRYFDQHPGRAPEAVATLRLLEEKAMSGDRESGLKLMDVLAGRIEAPAPSASTVKKRTPVKKVAVKRAGAKKA